MTSKQTESQMKNLPVGACSIIFTLNPEWGTWGIKEDCGDYYVIRGNRGTRILCKSEAARLWEIA